MIRAIAHERVSDASEVATARRAALQHAQAMGMGENAAGRVGLVATELATNLIKHAGGGTIVFARDIVRTRSLTLISLDRGRGIPNLSAAKRDGFSTAGSPGTGMGAIERASTSLEIFSVPERGTAVVCTIDDDARDAPVLQAPSRIRIGGISVPLRGEDANGDDWCAVANRDIATIAVIDGLGHGTLAADAAAQANRVLRERAEESLDALFQDLHAALRATRGAAISIARIHAGVNRVDFMGVGNVAGTIVSDDAVRKTVSLPGIVGHEMRKLQTFSYPWSASSVLVMQSDGVSANWNPASWPGLMQYSPELIAAVLYRDHARHSDDATVVVAKAS